jgi:hypothetical protein
VPIVCAKAPRRIGCVPAVRDPLRDPLRITADVLQGGAWVYTWSCSFCGARVKVVA